MSEALSMQQLGRIVRRYWLVLLAAVVLGGLSGYFGARLIPPTYTASATQLVKGIPGTDATANYQAAQYAISRSRTYPVFIDSQPVLEGVRSDFGGRIEVGELQERLSASNPIDTPLIQVTATGPTPEEARDMANSAARHLARYITQIETVNGSSPVNVEVAVQATRPYDPTAPRPLLTASLVAFAAGCLGLACVVLFDRVIRPWLSRRRALKTDRANESEPAEAESPDESPAAIIAPGAGSHHGSDPVGTENDAASGEPDAQNAPRKAEPSEVDNTDSDVDDPRGSATVHASA